MSDYAHHGRRSRLMIEPRGEGRSIESRAMFVACYALCLVRAMLARLMPWRSPAAYHGATASESIFKEARNAASVMVASSFMGL
jgi:hypothetical protein